MPLQPAYTSSKGEWEVAKRLASEVLCLPIHSKLRIDEIDLVAKTIKKFFEEI